jgi:hypothetical protein
MPSSYTSLLGFVQPTTGELTNTWGSTVNSQLTQLVEDSIASTSSFNITAADWTLSTTGGGQSNEARTAVLLVTGTPGTTRSIFAPKQSKVYVVVNNSNSSVVLKGGPVSPTTGVTVSTGVTALVVWDSSISDFVAAVAGVTSLTAGTNISLSGSTGSVTVNATPAGSTTQLQYNNAGSLGGTSGMTWSGTALTAPLATGSTAITQAEKTATTTLATTAFVDRLRSLTTPTTTSSGGTLVVGDRGSLVSVTAGVTIPSSVFAAQDVVTIYNNSASTITITQGASLTLRQVGTANTGNRSLALRGMATVVFISATEAVISGGGLS